LSTAIDQLTVRTIEVSRFGDPSRSTLDRGDGPNIPDRVEELANTITHGVGLVLSLAGLYALILITTRNGIAGQAAGCLIFGMSLVMLYSASTLYHGWRDEKGKRVLLLLDHICIYITIAGTYTPLALIPLRGRFGWTLLVLAWGFALVGIIAKVARIDRLDMDSPMPYIVMCTMILFGLGRLRAVAHPGEFEWLVAGGFFYLAGLVFFINHDRRFNHMIWHLFVLAGSVCHYRAVIGYVMPILS
jgi:hemolysin III